MAFTVRYVSSQTTAGGDGTTPAPAGANRAYTMAEALTKAGPNIEFRILNDGVHTVASNVTTTGTLATWEFPTLYRAYNATGDTPLVPVRNISGQFDESTLIKVAIASGVAITMTNSAWHLWHGLYFTSLLNGSAISSTNTNTYFHSCKFLGSGTGASAYPINIGYRNAIINSECITLGSGFTNAACSMANNSENYVYGCTFTAPSGGGCLVYSATCTVSDSLFNNAAFGVRCIGASTANIVLTNNTFNNMTLYAIGHRDAVATFKFPTHAYNNLFVNCPYEFARVTSGGVITDSATGVAPYIQLNNCVINAASGASGFGDWPQFARRATGSIGNVTFINQSGDFRLLANSFPEGSGLFGDRSPGVCGPVRNSFIPYMS